MSKSLKRKSSKTDLVSTDAQKKKKRTKKDSSLVIETESKDLLSVKELMTLTGLSEFMLTVAVDLVDSSLVLIDIVCPNENIRSMNDAAIEANYNLCTQKKRVSATTTTTTTNKKKSYPDDEVRKFIVERSEKELVAGGVRLAGSNQVEKMDNAEKDRLLVSEFLGFARTSKGYFVYAYYVGPDRPTLEERKEPANWIVVNKTHLVHFHKSLRDTKSFHTHTHYDQVSFKKRGNLNKTPSYDPRHMMYRWLSKEGKEHKPLLIKHKSLFANKDFLMKHYEEEETKALHYYEEGKPDSLEIDLTAMEVEGEQGSIFNAEADRLRQQKTGYRYNDKDICHVNIEEFPPLSRIPLPVEIDLTWEEYINVAQHVHVNERQPRPPETYVCDPFTMVKASMMALNIDLVAKRVPPLLGDAKLQIIEADNMKPVLDFIGSHKSCTDEIKKATLHQLYALFSVEMMTRELPAPLQEILDKEENASTLLAQ